jgi:hypothetical protein
LAGDVADDPTAVPGTPLAAKVKRSEKPKNLEFLSTKNDHFRGGCDAPQGRMPMSQQSVTAGKLAGKSKPTHPSVASGTHVHIPFKAALLVALAAGLGYGFDAYAVNIFGMLAPTIAPGPCPQA